MASYDTPFPGNYADLAGALDGHGERVEGPAEVGPALERAIEVTEDGIPVMAEVPTSEETDRSRH
ncbi:hypothetical protein [Halobaculum gomorrense]|uniref:hypothetical protein n=1 Tax=Halobaculum gomorrense TaxID=43928 RepID=UPI0009329BCC|nr:hypothetical protein [Halobaculum gomorrense]